MAFNEQDWQVMPQPTHDEALAFWSKLLDELKTPQFKDANPEMVDQLRRIAEYHIAERMWHKMQGTTGSAHGHTHTITQNPTKTK